MRMQGLAQPTLEIAGLRVHYGAALGLDNFSATFAPGEVTMVVGPARLRTARGM